MGQAASMCRFRGCRYKKDKNTQLQQQQQQQQQNYKTNLTLASNGVTMKSSKRKIGIVVETATPTITTLTATTATIPLQAEAGLHLCSIEEPASQTTSQQQQQQQQQSQKDNSRQQQKLPRSLSLPPPPPPPPLPSSSSSSSINPGDDGTGSCSSQTSAELAMAGTTAIDQQLLLSSNLAVPLTIYPPSLSSQQHYSSAVFPISPSTDETYDIEYARMEAWMDENQDFVQDYFIRKATRQVVDAWLVSHATTTSTDVYNISPTTSQQSGQNSSSHGGSGATTPVRKISAHEFERGGLLKPIVNTVDGMPTFLSIDNQTDYSMPSCSSSTSTSSISSSSASASGSYCPGANTSSHSCHSCHSSCQSSSGSSPHNYQLQHYHHHHPLHHHHHHLHQFHQRQRRMSRNELKQLDEKQLIFELVKDICNELEVRSLCHKILQNVSILLNADRGSLFLVQGRCGGSDGPKKYLVSKLFDVCPRSTVEDMEQRDEVQIAWGTGIAGHVAESGEPINIPDAYQDERFSCEIDIITGYRTKTLLCMPIKDSSGDVIGVAQVINKLNGECFSETDEKVFASYLQFCGIGLRNAQLYEKSQLEIKRNQVLLDLARMIFEEQSTIEHMVLRILTHMQSLIQCQRVQILLVHQASKGSFSRVFDFEANDLNEDGTPGRNSPHESRFPINIGITGYVATRGDTVNITNAYEDDRFDPSVDENTNFKHKSILCMAIKNSLGQIIGVIQLINKFNDLDFTKNDENFVEAFAIFCGMGIHNTHMYEKAIVAMAKQSVTLEVLSYHASATIEEANRLRCLRVPSAAYFQLHDFSFDDILYEDDETLQACLRMFLDLDFVERFNIEYEVLCRWLLSVKKNYRHVTYHNWRHAFNVAQMMFAILTATQWWKIFGEIECLALIIACLCHDLDHRGTNNSFQIKASSPLAQLYSTSTMEHHHFDQCLMILNSPGNQILANLSSDDYYRIIKVLEDAILSTDLAVYLRKRGSFFANVKSQPFSHWFEEEPRALLRAISMTVCDLSAITKPWLIEKRVADLVTLEFFEQGDVEKKELHIMPIDLMNREKANEIPMMQVGFIESICMPMYESFAHLSEKLVPLLDGVRNNHRHWLELAEEVQTKNKSGNSESEMQDSSNNTEPVIVTEKMLARRHSDGVHCEQLHSKSFSHDCIANQQMCLETSLNSDKCIVEGGDSDFEMHHCLIERYPSESSITSSAISGDRITVLMLSPTKSDGTPENQASLRTNVRVPSHRLMKLRSPCKACECLRLRKSHSLKNTNDSKHRCGCCPRIYSKSTPSVSSYGNCQLNSHPNCHQCRHNLHYCSSTTFQHCHNYKHHHHHHHHSHYLQHQQHQHQCDFRSISGCESGSFYEGGPTSDGSRSSSAMGVHPLLGTFPKQCVSPESDKIPKIVGKLNSLSPLHSDAMNSSTFSLASGQFSYLSPNLLQRQQPEAKPNIVISDANTTTNPANTAASRVTSSPPPLPSTSLVATASMETSMETEIVTSISTSTVVEATSTATSTATSIETATATTTSTAAESDTLIATSTATTTATSTASSTGTSTATETATFIETPTIITTSPKK